MGDCAVLRTAFPAQFGAGDCCVGTAAFCGFGNRVIRLSMSGVGLSGPIPAALKDLTALQTLILSNNGLSGPIPSFLGDLPLVSLWLDRNQLEGPIPASLGSRASLRQLLLDSNRLSGPLPSTFGREFFTLDISNNPGITGPLPAGLVSSASCRASGTGACVAAGSTGSACGLQTCSGSSPTPSNPSTGPTVSSNGPTTTIPGSGSPPTPSNPSTGPTPSPVVPTSPAKAVENAVSTGVNIGLIIGIVAAGLAVILGVIAFFWIRGKPRKTLKVQSNMFVQQPAPAMPPYATGAAAQAGTAPNAAVFPPSMPYVPTPAPSSAYSPSAGYATSTGSPPSAGFEPSAVGGSVHLSAPSTANMAVPSATTTLLRNLPQEPKEQASYIDAMPAESRAQLLAELLRAENAAAGSGAHASASDDPDQMYAIVEAESSFNPAYQPYAIMEASTAHVNPIRPMTPTTIDALGLPSSNGSSPYQQAPRP
ncbi:hypothetical protein BC831DRAFT_457715 [Entophlyctis helioformis]|nr:hypothetical protein BC831DRAFT_457715 [Entophlyctis helioformis]